MRELPSRWPVTQYGPSAGTGRPAAGPSRSVLRRRQLAAALRPLAHARAIVSVLEGAVTGLQANGTLVSKSLGTRIGSARAVLKSMTHFRSPSIHVILAIGAEVLRDLLLRTLGLPVAALHSAGARNISPML